MDSGRFVWCDVIPFICPQVKILKLRPQFICPILEWVNADYHCDFDCFWVTFGVTSIYIHHSPFAIRHSPFILPTAMHKKTPISGHLNCSRLSLTAHCSYAPLGNNSTMSSSLAEYAVALFRLPMKKKEKNRFASNSCKVFILHIRVEIYADLSCTRTI